MFRYYINFIYIKIVCCRFSENSCWSFFLHVEMSSAGWTIFCLMKLNRLFSQAYAYVCSSTSNVFSSMPGALRFDIYYRIVFKILYGCYASPKTIGILRNNALCLVLGNY